MIRNLILAGWLLTSGATVLAQSATPVPHIESKNGRHALIVDGAPFLMLSAQVNNSTNYAAPLATAWPVLDRLHAPESDVLADPHVIAHVVLENHSDLASQVLDRVIPQIDSVQQNTPGSGIVQPRQQLHESCLPGPVFSD